MGLEEIGLWILTIVEMEYLNTDLIERFAVALDDASKEGDEIWRLNAHVQGGERAHLMSVHGTQEEGVVALDALVQQLRVGHSDRADN